MKSNLSKSLQTSAKQVNKLWQRISTEMLHKLHILYTFYVRAVKLLHRKVTKVGVPDPIQKNQISQFQYKFEKTKKVKNKEVDTSLETDFHALSQWTNFYLNSLFGLKVKIFWECYMGCQTPQKWLAKPNLVSISCFYFMKQEKIATFDVR